MDLAWGSENQSGTSRVTVISLFISLSAMRPPGGTGRQSGFKVKFVTSGRLRLRHVRNLLRLGDLHRRLTGHRNVDLA